MPRISWQITDGGNNINDAMLARSLDIAATGIPGYQVLRDRTLGGKQELIGISSLSFGALWLNSINPRLKSLTDYGPGDRIAVPGIKTSFAAVVLQMAVAKQFGIENYAELDPLTVGMPHPDAYAAMMSGRTDGDHFAFGLAAVFVSGVEKPGSTPSPEHCLRGGQAERLDGNDAALFCRRQSRSHAGISRSTERGQRLHRG